MTRRFRLILSGALGLLAALACVAAADQGRAQADAERQEAMSRYGGEVVQVVVASHDLEPGDEIGPYSCEMTEWLVDLVPEGTLMSLEECTGSQVTSPVARGMPLCEVHLRSSEERVEVPSGCVAISVPIQDRTGIPKGVPQGTLLAAYRIQDGVVRLIGSELTVLGNSGSQGTSAATVTVAVEPAQVAALVAASTDGTLRLVQPAADVPALLAEAEVAQGPTRVEAVVAEGDGSDGGPDAEGTGSMEQVTDEVPQAEGPTSEGETSGEASADPGDGR